MKRKAPKHFDDDYDEYSGADVNLNDLINDDNVKIINMKDYEIQSSRIIGAGAYSKTYEAIEKATGKRLAAKISSDDSDENQTRNFINQVRIMSKLDFPSIIKFIGCGITEGKGRQNRVILLELAANGTLGNAIKQVRKNNAPTDWTDTKKHIILYGIASGMAYMHSLDYVFRNLTPENILLDEYLFPKICDFSLAAKSDESLSDFVGTPVYMAPEVIEGEQYVKASDVYSFSMIMYELLTNEVPFKNITVFKLQSMIVSGNRPDIPEYLPDVYKNLIERCWAQDPNDRPSFKEIKTILQNDINDLEIDNDDFDDYCDMITSHESELSGWGVFSHPICNPARPEIDSNKQKMKDEYSEGESDSENLIISDDDIAKKHKFKRVKIDFPEEEYENKKLDVKIDPIDIGKFEKREQIGEGSFGKVYKAIDKETGQICAAKVNRKELVQCDDNDINNLSREINILAQIESPLIVKFIGFNTVDFHEDSKPTIVTEFIKNGSLRDIIEAELRGLSLPEWDETKKLIVIYGVASGLAYLHAHEILHRDIKPENIFLDEFLFPKIGDFGLAKEIKDDTTTAFVGTPLFISPEIINDAQYTKAGDVYAYAMLVYSLLTLKDPFDEKNQFTIFKKVSKGYRPLFPDNVPECYQNLLRKCWSHLPEERPTFEDIIDIIKANPDFITSGVDEDEFIKYVDSIGDTFYADEKTIKKDVRSRSKKVSFKEVSFDMQKIKEEDKIIEMVEEDPEMKETFLDLSEFEKVRLVTKGDNYKIYEVKNKNTKIIYSAKVSTIKVNQLTKDELIHLSREVGIISQLKHPSFLQFIGYSPINFKRKSMPVIISELPFNKSLLNLVEMERKNKKVPEWNETKRLINIYGIAAGMSYLHSHKIIHRNLGLNSIFLDEFLLPKIGNFGFSTRVHTIKTITMQSTSGIKGNPSYSAPEVLEHGDYTKASDVYAFGIIVYELMTLKKPFKKNSYNDIYNEVVLKDKRPKLDNNIPKCYRNLIDVCWSANPEARPSFENIEDILRTDENFITQKVDKNDFIQYIQSISQEKVGFGERKRVAQLDYLIDKKCRIQEEDEIRNGEEEEKIENIESEVDRLINIKSFDPIKINLVKGLLSKKEKVTTTSSSTIYRVKIGKSSFDSDFVSLRILKEKIFSKSDDDDEKGFNIDESKMEQFYSYCQKVHLLNHPNIARSFGFFRGNSKHEPLLLSEYFSKSLKEAVKSLDDIYLVSIIYEISHAMMILHSNNLIHRNLRPENIFIDSSKHAKLTDFADELLLNVTDQIKSEKIKPVCMSPELLQNREYDEKVDVFSFGVVMHFILSRGKAVFLSKEQIIAGEDQLIRKTINKISFSIIKRCMSQSPENRPSFRAITQTIQRNNFVLIDGIESNIPMIQNQVKSIIDIKKVKEKK
ncbi:hypothetical protein M9Y10_003457 [Tritrichomonas musculus]|uniref:Protein kinase domain-containing protein n=1 Tax=Tritrichomonas musculus TaxID=1915356 RepID=A0ABR2JPG2_9EUKA